MKLRCFVVGCLVLLFTSFIAAQDEGVVTSVDCPFDIPEGEVQGETIDCVIVTVPESRTGLSDAEIELAVVILYATGEETLPPLLYLAGGPGNSGTSAAEDFFEDPIRESTSIIFLDQRGTGYSLPSLDCYEDNEADCYQRLLSEGIVLDAYRSSENAADVNDVIEALELDSVTLYGISYGSRLALTVMKNPHPAIQSVILDGVYPPNVNAYEEDAPNIVRVFELVFENCAQDEACNAAYPNLADTFYETFESLNADPLMVGDQEITGDVLYNKMFQSFYITSFIPDAPFWIYAAYHRDAERLAELFVDESETHSMSQIAMLKQSPENDGNSEGMFTNVECADEVPFNTEEGITVAVADLGLPDAWAEGSVQDALDILSMCEDWVVTPSDESVREATVSDLPTLILNGEYDPVTPPHWAEIAAETLPNSYIFIIPAGGHGVITMSECTESIAEQFLYDPTTEPDGSCIEDMPPPAWYIEQP